MNPYSDLCLGFGEQVKPAVLSCLVLRQSVSEDEEPLSSVRYIE